MRKITHISVHCSDTKGGRAHDITTYHKKVKHWKDIGYHYVILNGKVSGGYEPLLDGAIETGRPLSMTPAAVRGHNEGMIAVCLIGKDEFTEAQFVSLFKLLLSLRKRYGVAVRDILGHREYPKVKKKCPCFDVGNMRKALNAWERLIKPER